MALKLYPLGMQTFERIRKENRLYVDKTEYIYCMTNTDIFLIEIKLNKSAAAAIGQIDLKNYRQRFAMSGKPITKVGINFDTATGNISDWQIER